MNFFSFTFPLCECFSYFALSNGPFLTYRKASLILSLLKFGERFEVVTLVEQIHYGLVSQKSR